MPICRLPALILILPMLALGACSGGGSSHAESKPAKVEPVAHETELMKITLTPQAEERLGIATAAVATSGGGQADTIATHGEIVVPNTAGGPPITTATDLAALAGNQVRADGDVARVRAEVAIARTNLSRAEALVREEAGSIKMRDDAAAALAVATANLAAAQAQRRLLGAPVAVLGRNGMLWVRVPVLAADLPRVDRAAPAQVRSLGRNGPALGARPVAAPPSSNPAAGSVDLYFAIANRGGLQVGERVAVEIAASGGGGPRGFAIPASAILHDAYGGEWVYALVKPRSYERRRVQVASIDGPVALLARGLNAGDKVVTAGAAELFGTEFGAK